MVKGLDEDEAHFLDEVSRQQCLVEKQRRDEEKQELQEYRISFHFVARALYHNFANTARVLSLLASY